MEILTVPHPVLIQVAHKVTDFRRYVGLEKLTKDMFELLYTSDKKKQIGVGLAAPQVGESLRLIVLNVPGYSAMAMCNPVIDWAKDEGLAEEGCLSIPGVRRKIKRATKIRITYQTLAAATVTIVARDLLARTIQHEIDHLEGILITDYSDDGERI